MFYMEENSKTRTSVTYHGSNTLSTGLHLKDISVASFINLVTVHLRICAC